MQCVFIGERSIHDTKNHKRASMLFLQLFETNRESEGGPNFNVTAASPLNEVDHNQSSFAFGFRPRRDGGAGGSEERMDFASAISLGMYSLSAATMTEEWSCPYLAARMRIARRTSSGQSNMTRGRLGLFAMPSSIAEDEFSNKPIPPNCQRLNSIPASTYESSHIDTISLLTNFRNFHTMNASRRRTSAVGTVSRRRSAL